MEKVGRTKAVSLLTTERLTGDLKYLPRVWVIGRDVSITKNAAKRAVRIQYLLTGIKYKIEEMSTEEAYKIKYGKPMPESFRKKVDWWLNQQGGLNHQEELNDD